MVRKPIFTIPSKKYPPSPSKRPKRGKLVSRKLPKSHLFLVFFELPLARYKVMQLLVTFQVTDDLNNAVKMKVSRFPCELPCNIMGQLYSKVTCAHFLFEPIPATLSPFLSTRSFPPDFAIMFLSSAFAPLVRGLGASTTLLEGEETSSTRRECMMDMFAMSEMRLTNT